MFEGKGVKLQKLMMMGLSYLEGTNSSISNTYILMPSLNFHSNTIRAIKIKNIKYYSQNTNVLCKKLHSATEGHRHMNL